MHLRLYGDNSKLLGSSLLWLAFGCFKTSEKDIITSSHLLLVTLLVFTKPKAFAAQVLIETEPEAL